MLICNYCKLWYIIYFFPMRYFKINPNNGSINCNSWNCTHTYTELQMKHY